MIPKVVEAEKDYTELSFTGERYVPTIGGSIELEHQHRYRIFADLCKGKIVADIACGEGYGTDLIAVNAKKVWGIDIDEKTIEFASKKYIRDNIQFIAKSAQSTGLETHSVDIVLSFETLEHHSHHEEMLTEFKRILKPNGILIISTPDKRNTTDLTGNVNPHHAKELYKEEFIELISRYFSNHSLLSQRVIAGSAISIDEPGEHAFISIHGSDWESRATKLVPTPYFWIAVASDGHLPEIANSFLHDITDLDQLHLSQYENEVRKKVITHRDHDIEVLKSTIDKLNSDLRRYMEIADLHGRQLTDIDSTRRFNEDPYDAHLENRQTFNIENISKQNKIKKFESQPLLKVIQSIKRIIGR